ncbi:MAG: hypothetical protein WDN28_33230 [Chthoniobacter sp.]
MLYDPGSALRQRAQSPGNTLGTFTIGSPSPGAPLAGDIQINGPGTLEVLAGRNLDLGDGPNYNDGTGVGHYQHWECRNPFLPFDGASIVAMAGIGGPGDLLGNGTLNFPSFADQFLSSGASGSSTYLAELGLKSSAVDSLSEEQKALLALQVSISFSATQAATTPRPPLPRV